MVAREGTIDAVSDQDGKTVWKAPAFGTITAVPNFSTHGVVFGTAEKLIVVLSPSNGSVIFRKELNFIPTAVSNPALNVLIVGDERGNVVLLSAETGRTTWKFKSGAGISHVSMAKEGLIVTSLDNFIYLISMYNGDVVWKRRLSGRVAEVTVLAGNFIFGLIYGENSAFLIDSEKGKIVDQLVPNEKNYVNSMPLLVGNQSILLTTTRGVELHGLNACGAK